MQAAVVVLFLTVPMIAGASLSLEGFVVFLLVAGLIAGLSTGQDGEDELGEVSDRRRSRPRVAKEPGLGAPPAYTVDIKLGHKFGHKFGRKFGRMSAMRPTAISSLHRENAHDAAMTQFQFLGGHRHGS